MQRWKYIMENHGEVHLNKHRIFVSSAVIDLWEVSLTKNIKPSLKSLSRNLISYSWMNVLISCSREKVVLKSNFPSCKYHFHASRIKNPKICQEIKDINFWLTKQHIYIVWPACGSIAGGRMNVSIYWCLSCVHNRKFGTLS